MKNEEAVNVIGGRRADYSLPVLMLSHGEWYKDMMRGGSSTELRKEFGLWINIDLGSYLSSSSY